MKGDLCLVEGPSIAICFDNLWNSARGLGNGDSVEAMLRISRSSDRALQRRNKGCQCPPSL